MKHGWFYRRSCKHEAQANEPALCAYSIALIASAAFLSVLCHAHLLFADEKPPKPIPNATEYRDVRYLPEWRYADDPAPHRDGQMVMDIVVPDDSLSEHPLLFVVHGGGWSAGDKNQSIYREVMQYFVERGFVCVGFNYILRPRGMFPQVFWDYADAVRFMRRKAKTYKVNVEQFGAIGFSAGGWLISSAGHGSGDLFCHEHQQSSHIGKLWERNWRFGSKEREGTFLKTMVSTSPIDPGIYGQVQAISYDFAFRTKFASGNSPACNQWVGEGYKLRPDDQAAVESGKFDYSQTVFTHPGYKGRKLHVPPLFKSIQKDGSDKSEAFSLDGKSRVPAIERIYQFFKHTLIDDPRTPVPEIWPSNRFFADKVAVRFVVPSQDVVIRYQVLPLLKQKGKPWNEVYPPVANDEWKQWTQYDGPFELTGDSLVRAVSQRNGQRESTVAEAHFFKGVTTAKITAPLERELPAAVTGKPYSVQFKADVASARWFIAGDLVPHKKRNTAEWAYPNNMLLDGHTGRWRGTPTQPGKYWIQIWVNQEEGAPATHRDYTWTVTGKDISDQPAATAELSDPNVELVYLPGKKNNHADQLVKVLNAHGIRTIVQREKQGSLFLVRKDERDKARRLIEAHLKSIKYKGELHWQ